ncbi:hypothetical protein C8F01DRAFT_1162724 [Mycena amicta]|nr:hypothetical protein C8F01DRAFT_1162724 [Mycena amicta]
MVDDPIAYRVGNDHLVYGRNDETPSRFFTVGYTTEESRTGTYDDSGQYIRAVLTASHVGRIFGVLRWICGVDDIVLWAYRDGITFTTFTPRKPSSAGTFNPNSPRKSSNNEPIPPVLDGTGIFKWGRRAVLPANAQIPIYDGRNTEFAMQNYRSLPLFSDDSRCIPANCVVIIVFALNVWTPPTGSSSSLTRVTFNIAEAVVLHGPANPPAAMECGETKSPLRYKPSSDDSED